MFLSINIRHIYLLDIRESSITFSIIIKGSPSYPSLECTVIHRQFLGSVNLIHQMFLSVRIRRIYLLDIVKQNALSIFMFLSVKIRRIYLSDIRLSSMDIVKQNALSIFTK